MWGRRGSRPWSAGLLVMIVLAGCTYEDSPVDDDAVITVSSRVVDSAGRGVDGAEVRLGSVGALSDLLGFVCLPVTFCSRDGASKELRSGADGAVEVTATGSETKTLLGGKRLLTLGAASPALPVGALGRGGVEAAFEVESEQVRLGALPLWEPTVTVGGSGVGRRVGFGSLPGGGAGADLVVTDAGGSVVARIGGVKEGSALDGRLLEDLAVRAAVVVAGDLEGAQGVQWRSPTWPVTGQLRPPSRGAACVRVDRDARATVTRDCGLTDGDLRTQGPRAADDCARLAAEPLALCRERVATTTLDLGAVRAVELVVLRGSTRRVGLEVSADGRSWRGFGPQAQLTDPDPGGFQVVRGKDRVRYLRWADAEDLVEVTAW